MEDTLKSLQLPSPGHLLADSLHEAASFSVTAQLTRALQYALALGTPGLAGGPERSLNHAHCGETCPCQGRSAGSSLRLFKTRRVKKLMPCLQMEGLRATSKVIV